MAIRFKALSIKTKSSMEKNVVKMRMKTVKSRKSEIKTPIVKGSNEAKITEEKNLTVPNPKKPKPPPISSLIKLIRKKKCLMTQS